MGKIKDIYKYYDQYVEQFKVLTEEEERKYFKEYKEGNLELHDLLVKSNLRLVLSVARNYHYDNADRMEIIQEGNYGLLEAIEKFNPDLGYRFSTYAVPWIKQAINYYMPTNMGMIRIPHNRYEEIKSINKKITQLQLEKGSNVTQKEIKEMFENDIRYDLYQKATMASTIERLETPVGEEKEEELGNFIADEKQMPIEDQIILKDLSIRVHELLELLNDSERDVILKRYGFYGGEYKLEEIGEQRGVSRQRIEQIEKSALAKLQRYAKWRRFGGW